jgi:hypothetical protein
VGRLASDAKLGDDWLKRVAAMDFGTGAREEVDAAVQELMIETKCPICLDFFTNPRSAPCQHNFCEVCVLWHYLCVSFPVTRVQVNNLTRPAVHCPHNSRGCVISKECIWEYIKDSHSECPSCRNPGTNRRSLSRNNQLRNITQQVRRLACALGKEARFKFAQRHPACMCVWYQI